MMKKEWIPNITIGQDYDVAYKDARIAKYTLFYPAKPCLILTKIFMKPKIAPPFIRHQQRHTLF